MLNKTIGPPAVYAKETTPGMLKKQPVMILPSGSLAGKENDSTFKQVLNQYVENNCTLIVFGLQFGDHVSLVVPTPQGEALRAYGWRESNSCTRDSSFFDSYHPALASLTKANANVGVDGYFSAIPDGSTVLLRAAANKNFMLISYKYGQGTVILTSMVSDFSYAHSQAAMTELNLVRDLIANAKNPNLPIGGYNKK